ncbi:hypothetical protein A8B81_15760 [Sulfitobacter pontiacus]|uniref:hypothetical protein n=1 Tax=Sulfitobacter pontiacus TaxID=60137 RepID=UPI0007D9011C|nr:hypothetical protein [Sulfitobacter pontiacus]OAN77245.1 hypothetical protein A8B81_15760 [Sulfitobacter pontiacus]
MTISKKILDELLKGVERPEDLLSNVGLMKELKVELMERMLGAERAAPTSSWISKHNDWAVQFSMTIPGQPSATASKAPYSSMYVSRTLGN